MSLMSMLSPTSIIRSCILLMESLREKRLVGSRIGGTWAIQLWTLGGVAQLLFCPLEGTYLGVCFFLPYSTATSEKKEGFKVLVTLREAALPAFREDMKVFCNSQEQWLSHI